jgi:FAD/FMN-containing dehydrogenase
MRAPFIFWLNRGRGEMSLEERLRGITAVGRVFDATDALETYSRDESFMPKVRPRCIVKPKDMEEVRKIVMLANETGTPIVPISSGAPHFRGDSIPSVGGAVIVDLHGMDRILRIDSKNKVAMIEPGVTFGHLIEALKEEGLAPYMPLVPRSSKSVLTSYLEREPITIPRDHWETQDPLLCTEVVYGSGDLFRTGSAAGPGTPEEQWEVGRAMIRGLGPTHTDFAKLNQAAQGTIGIVTWATVKCRRLPRISKTFFVPSEDLVPIIDLVYRVMWKRLGNHVLILNNHNLASILSENKESMKKLRDQLPPWIFMLNIEGGGLMPEEKVAWQEAAFKNEAQDCGLEPTTIIAGLKSYNAMDVLSKPSSEPYWKLRCREGNHDIFFITTLDRVPQFIDQLNNLAKSFIYPATNVGIYLQPTIQGTNCHCEFNLPYDPKNALEADRIKALDRDASRIFANMGGFFSRPYGAWAETAYGRDPATVIALRKVKNIFDPNKVMNPGKLCF